MTQIFDNGVLVSLLFKGDDMHNLIDLAIIALLLSLVALSFDQGRQYGEWRMKKMIEADSPVDFPYNKV